MLTVCKDSKLHSLGPEGMGWSLANEDEAASITGLRLLFLLEEKESHDHDLAHDVPQPSNLSVCVCVRVCFFFGCFLHFLVLFQSYGNTSFCVPLFFSNLQKSYVGRCCSSKLILFFVHGSRVHESQHSNEAGICCRVPLHLPYNGQHIYWLFPILL